MNISTLDKVMIGVCAVMLVFAGGVGAVAMGVNGGPADTNQTQPTQTATPSADTEQEVPPAVEESYDGATLLKEKLQETEKFSNASVYVAKNGEVVVDYTSDVQYGTELKGEMAEVAFIYAEVMGEHPETGGLTVSANNVAMLVSSDTAAAYSNGDIKKSAYEETFAYKTANKTQTEG